jgi:hypothetical protein
LLEAVEETVATPPLAEAAQLTMVSAGAWATALPTKRRSKLRTAIAFVATVRDDNTRIVPTPV